MMGRLMRCVSAALVAAFLFVCVGGVPARAQDYQRDRGNHNGWTRGQHRGWSHSNHYGTRSRYDRGRYRRAHRTRRYYRLWNRGQWRDWTPDYNVPRR